MNVKTFHGDGIEQRFEGTPVDRAREFVATVLAPRVADLDARVDPAECFSWEIVEEADARGLRTLLCDRRFGGEGLDLPSFVQVFIELARGDLGIAALLVQTNHLAKTLEVSGTPKQVSRYLPAICADPHFLLAFASSEPNVGSDSILAPTGRAGARYQTRAVRDKGGWRINGLKHFIENGNLAKLCIVRAQTDDSTSLAEGSTCFLVEAGTPGLRSGIVHNKSGERLANHAEVILEDCWVPDENVLGGVNQGESVMAPGFPRNTMTAATALGVGEAAYDSAVAWVTSRVQGGRRLIEHDPVRVDLARQRMLLDVARGYLESHVRAIDSGESYSRSGGIEAKVFATEATWGMVRLAIDLYDGLGYMCGSPVEKLLRDAASFFHAGGSNRVLLLKVARMLWDGG